jgi:hypothetical protein
LHYTSKRGTFADGKLTPKGPEFPESDATQPIPGP